MSTDVVINNDTLIPVCKNVAAACLWLVGVSLGDVQVLVSIVSGILVAVYTGFNLYVLWRDKIRGHK